MHAHTHVGIDVHKISCNGHTSLFLRVTDQSHFLSGSFVEKQPYCGQPSWAFISPLLLKVNPLLIRNIGLAGTSWATTDSSLHLQAT